MTQLPAPSHGPGPLSWLQALSGSPHSLTQHLKGLCSQAWWVD